MTTKFTALFTCEACGWQAEVEDEDAILEHMQDVVTLHIHATRQGTA